MKHRLASAILMMCACSATTVRAQDISGTWQGSDKSRHVLKIFKAPNGGYRGNFYNLDAEVPGDPANGNPISAITRNGRTVTFMLDRSAGNFEGTLAADGKSMSGTWETRAPKHSLTLERATGNSAWVIDPSPHKTQFVTVADGVRLEVLDWGGSGPPLIFLAGLGNTAHVFDSFALKFTGQHHVYAITRRGIGLSSAPPPTEENYDADRLGDDVLAVMDALKLDRPVLAGHSIAGEELSSIGTRHPEKVSGLIYLDATGVQAFYNDSGDLGVDVATVRRDLERLPHLASSTSQSRALIQEIQTTLPILQKSLQEYDHILAGMPELPPLRQTQELLVGDAIVGNERKYTDIKAPILAIIAVPHGCQPNCESASAKALAAQDVRLADAFEAGNPSAKILRLPYANHYVFRSNEADVEQAMNSFMASLH